jgi:hypothetical protein
MLTLSTAILHVHIVQWTTWGNTLCSLHLDFTKKNLTVQDCGSQNMNFILSEVCWLLACCEEDNWYPYLMKWEWNENNILNSISILVGMDLITCYLFFLIWNNSTNILLVEASTTRREVLVIVASPWPLAHQLLTFGSTSTTTKFQAPSYNTQHGFWNNYEIW